MINGRRCDNTVTSWILNSLSKDLPDSLQYVNNAKELWDELKDRYDQANGAKLYQIQQELSSLTQGNLDVTGYYTNIKRLWEELATLDTTRCTCLCTCGGKNKLHKAEQNCARKHFDDESSTHHGTDFLHLSSGRKTKRNQTTFSSSSGFHIIECIYKQQLRF